MDINILEDNIVLNTVANNVLIAKDTLLPKVFWDNNQEKITTYNIETNSVNNIQI